MPLLGHIMRADYREVFFEARLLSMVALFSVVVGQQGVSLQLQGQTIPNNSLVNLEDFLYNPPEAPTNANGLQTLMCVTDLIACCETQGLGNWHYPDGNKVTGMGFPTFLTNRGQNEVINGQQFYGSVRIWRRYTPPERGLFHCELPDANGVNQNLYVNILFFRFVPNSVSSVAISHSGSSTAGEEYSLICTATLFHGNPPLPDPNIPSPIFEWFIGPNGNAPLPAGLTPTPTVLINNINYTSTLRFSKLSEFHTGNYTCRLGTGSLVNSYMFTVAVPSISVAITANLNAPGPLTVGQTGNTLTCNVSGVDRLNPTITYQWTRNGAAVPDSSSRTLNLSPLQLSHAGEYICHITVHSTLISNGISASSNNTQSVIVQVPDPQSVTLAISGGATVLNGADVILDCTVKLGPAVIGSELLLLRVDVQLSRDGIIMRTLSYPLISGTTLTYTTVLDSFHRSDSGNYSCMVTIRSQSSSIYLYSTGELSNRIQVTTGDRTDLVRYYSLSCPTINQRVYSQEHIVASLHDTVRVGKLHSRVYFFSRSSNIITNSRIIVTDIGEGDCGALLCFTDLIECCHDSDTPAGVGALGQWLYPNGSVVGTRRDGQDFYIDRGHNFVRLKRKCASNITSITGLFCCVVPDATSTNTKICINVVGPQSKQAAMCTSEVGIGAAVAVVVTILIECLIGAPIITLLHCKKRRESTGKTSYYTIKHEFKGGDKNDIDRFSNKKTTASNITQEHRVRDSADYEDPDSNSPIGTKSAVQGGEVRESTYEPIEINSGMQGVREDNYSMHVIPDNMSTTIVTPAIQGDGDTYEVMDNNNTTDAAAVASAMLGDAHGVRERVYDDPALQPRSYYMHS